MDYLEFDGNDVNFDVDELRPIEQRRFVKFVHGLLRMRPPVKPKACETPVPAEGVITKGLPEAPSPKFPEMDPFAEESHAVQAPMQENDLMSHDAHALAMFRAGEFDFGWNA